MKVLAFVCVCLCWLTLIFRGTFYSSMSFTNHNAFCPFLVVGTYFPFGFFTHLLSPRSVAPILVSTWSGHPHTLWPQGWVTLLRSITQYLLGDELLPGRPETPVQNTPSIWSYAMGVAQSKVATQLPQPPYKGILGTNDGYRFGIR